MKTQSIRVIFMTAIVLMGLGASPAPGRGAPVAQKTTLSNGLTLIVAERGQLPTIHLQVLVRAGAIRNGPEKMGLANLTAELLTQGTTKRSAARISREIESVGGSLSAGSDLDFATVSLAVLKKDLPLGLTLLSDILSDPLFEDSERERKIAELKARLKRMDEEPQQVAHLAFLKNLFGSHPYAFPKEGLPETLSKLTRQDIQDFFKAYYRPNNAGIIVVGQIGLEEAARLLEKYLSDWKPAPVESPRLPSPPAIDKPRVIAVDRPISQANIVWGHLGIARSNPDYYALQVMNYILGGGGFVSRLMDTIRDNLGLTYGIHSHFDARADRGAFQISLETKNQNANQAISEILKELRLFIEKGIRPSELDEAKAYLTGSFPLRMDTNSKLVRLLTAIEFYGLGLDFPERYARLINQVTAEDVLRAARTYLKPEHFLLVAVGNLKEMNLKESW
jgi:zinc protease